MKLKPSPSALLPLISLLVSVCTQSSHGGTTLSETPLWEINVGERSYVTSGSTERSIAYNPANDHVLLASRAGGHKVAVMDGSDGAEAYFLNVTGLSGGTFVLNHVGVADDGVVYGCNLVNPSSSTAAVAFKIYRWSDDTAATVPTTAFNGDPAGANGANSNSVQRWGDTFAVRGSGVNTQIIVGTSTLSLTGYTTTGVALAIFTTTDGLNFTPTFFSAGLESGGNRGIAFGESDTFYSKAAGATKKIRRSGFTLSPANAPTLQDHAVLPALTADSLVPLATQFTDTAKYLATLEMNGTTVVGNPELVRLYDISSPAVLPTLLDSKPLTPNNANANLVGSVALGGGRVYVCATNNGVQAYSIVVTPDVVAPAVSTSPAARTVLARGQTTFDITATGTPPLSYQWYKDDILLTDAITPSLTINPVAASSAGAYKCRVTNSGGFADSTPANLTAQPSVDSSVLTEVWHLAPGSRAYLQNDDAQRGLGYNPINQHLYLVTRTPTLAVRVLDATNGADVGTLDLTGVTGGNFALSMIDVSDDGVIYACNLSNTTDGSSFKIYRWVNDDATTTPTTIYEGNPISSRIGDNFDVRGSGATTQIIAGGRNVNSFVVLSTQDGISYSLVSFTSPASPLSGFGLGICFGEGDTIWGKSQGVGLSYVDFNLETGLANVIQFFPTTNFASTVSPITVDLASRSLMGISMENSDNVQIYDLPVPYPSNQPTTLTLLDQEFLPADNPNSNGTGAIALKNNKAFALDTNNGIVAYTVTKSLPVDAFIKDVSFNANTSQITFALHGEVGATYLIQRSSDLTTGTWTSDGTELLATQDMPITRAANAVNGRIFFRAVKQ